VGGGIGTLIIGVIIYLLGGDPSQIINQGQSGSMPLTEEQKAAEDSAAAFVKVVLADTEDVWNKQFAEMGQDYKEPTMVLFNGATQSGCGGASSATGPFYCPLDQGVYLDLSFYRELKERFSAPGDFAMAYVVAHEVGHHVQQLLGITDKVRNLQERTSQERGNELSVRLELQADFFAGLWANHAQQMQQILDPGDIEEALNAANAIGDDRLQMESQGRIVPESFTHGTSEQRMYWFKKGFQTGDINQGDTFAAEEL